MTQTPIIQATSVTRSFKMGGHTLMALSGVDFTVQKGQYISIMGPSGSGKSTLFNMIGALDLPTSGTIRIGGIDLATLSHRQLAYFRGRHLGYVFQSYNLIPSMTALRNVSLPLILAGTPPDQAQAQAENALTRVDLAHRMHHWPGELSGGQQQRVAIARAIVAKPSILLADEPTANLDRKTGQSIIDLLKKMSVESGVTVVTATHDFEMLAISDQVVWLADGKVQRIANKDELKIQSGQIAGKH
jgi:putative ABC transport system ATP-binding protein